MKESLDLKSYLDRLAEPGWLAMPAIPGERCTLCSSLNQKHGPRDCNYFLRDETDAEGVNWHVLVDLEGPGCLTRFWTGGRFDGGLEIWLDGEPTPRYQTTINAFFGAELPHFQPPLVLDSPASSEGRVSYMPIPFEKRCKVRSCSDSPSFYWQINALRYDDSIHVETIPHDLGERETDSLHRIADNWHRAEPATSLTWQDISCYADAETLLFDQTQPGTIETLAFDVGNSPQTTLLNLHLMIYWDGCKEPAVNLSLADLSFQRSAPAETSSLLMRYSQGCLICALPMPFAACRIILMNSGNNDIKLSWARHIATTDSVSSLRLCAQTQQRQVGYGLPIQLVKTEGAGRLVGLYLTTEQLPPVESVPYFNQEGNEYIYVDKDKDPSWIGTGTEDYFNCSYYYDRGMVSTPTHGCVDLRQDVGGQKNAGIVGAYRWHLLDSIPYDERLLMILEAGCPKKGAISGVNGREILDYAWTLFWYSDRGVISNTRREDLTL